MVHNACKLKVGVGLMERLLCIVGSLNAGGAETFLMKVYRSLDRNKYQMDFCVANPEKGVYEDEIQSLGGKIHVIPFKSDGFREFRKALYKVVKDGNYRRVLRITSNAAGLVDLKIAKAAGATRCIARSSNSSDGTSIKNKVINFICKVLYLKYVDEMVAPSDLAAIYTFGKKAVTNGKVHKLNNGVDLSTFYYSVEGRAKIRKEFDLGESTVIGHVGRFMQQKNHKFLLQVFAEIRKHVDAKLMLTGKGELENELRQQAKELNIDEYVVFTGLRKDVPEILSAMDIMVFPSLYEGMPNTIIEAQATGLPCLISDSITREANITGLVKYKSLNTSAADWAEDVMAMIGKKREDTKKAFISHGYDIQGVVGQLVEIAYK